MTISPNQIRHRLYGRFYDRVSILAALITAAVFLSGCATTTQTSSTISTEAVADRWTTISDSSAPVTVTLPWARLKPVRVRQRKVGENDDLITETSLSHRGRTHPIVTILVQDVQSNKHAFVRLNKKSNPLDARIRGLLGAHVAEVGEVSGATNQIGRVEYVDYTTTRSESCIGFRQYTGLSSAGKQIKEGTLLGTRLLLGLYCESGSYPISRERISTLLGAYRIR